MSEIWKLIQDPTFFLFILFWALYAVGAWGISTVLPQVIKDMDITDSARTQLLQIPPAAIGVLMCVASSYLVRNRGVNAFAVIIAVLLGVVVCYIVFIFAEAKLVRYLAVSVVSGSCTCAYAAMWPRRVAALRGATASALGIGLTNATSQLSGLVGPFLFRSDYAPRYTNSAKGAAVLVGADVLVVALLWWLMEGQLRVLPKWLSRRVLSQTRITEEDRVAAERGATVGNGRQELEGGNRTVAGDEKV